MTKYVEHIVDLAKDVDSQCAIDWAMLNIDEDAAYRLIASKVVEYMLPKCDDPILFRDIMLATVVQLVVENFTLNIKLHGRS
jgi:hypothetical protein